MHVFVQDCFHPLMYLPKPYLLTNINNRFRKTGLSERRKGLARMLWTTHFVGTY